jgi:predicted HAD superfamily Cof-like phosphohydrolase
MAYVNGVSHVETVAAEVQHAQQHAPQQPQQLPPVPQAGNVFDDQKRMMRAYQHNTVEQRLDSETMTLYLRLMCEEFQETLLAANPDETRRINMVFGALVGFAVVSPAANHVELFDGLIDMIVVTAGAGVSAGYPMQQGWDEVYQSNLAKLDPKTGELKRRADGKVLKPEYWQPPDLARLLTAAHYRKNEQTEMPV